MDHPWYQTLTRRDTETVRAYAQWLGQIQWKLFATFTFAWTVSDAQADVVFRAFINEIEHQIRSPLAFVRGDEKREAGYGLAESGRHYHVLFTSNANLDPITIAKTWRRFGGSGHNLDSARADLYKADLPGAEYSLKLINETKGDWKFRNLDLFIPGYKPLKSNKRSRRRISRSDARTSHPA